MGECIKFGRGKMLPYRPNFADNSWNKIISACQSGDIPETWNVGDQKAMTISGTEYLIDIIGKNHDDYADGSGKAPLTFQFHECYSTTYVMNSSQTNTGSWKNSAMRTTHIGNILQSMPSEVQAAVREVTKETYAYNAYTTDKTADKLFLLSEKEFFGITNKSRLGGGGTVYEYYANGGATTSSPMSAKAQKRDRNGNFVEHWQRCPSNTNAYNFCVVSNTGYANESSANGAKYVAPAFCF